MICCTATCHGCKCKICWVGERLWRHFTSQLGNPRSSKPNQQDLPSLYFSFSPPPTPPRDLFCCNTIIYTARTNENVGCSERDADLPFFSRIPPKDPSRSGVVVILELLVSTGCILSPEVLPVSDPGHAPPAPRDHAPRPARTHDATGSDWSSGQPPGDAALREAVPRRRGCPPIHRPVRSKARTDIQGKRISLIHFGDQRGFPSTCSHPPNPESCVWVFSQVFSKRSSPSIGRCKPCSLQ